MSTATATVQLDVVRLEGAAINLVRPYGARERVLPPDITLRTVESPHGPLTARMRMFAVPGMGELRSVSLVGHEISALQLVALPRPDREVGVFLAEFQVGLGEPSVAIDVQTVVGTRVAAASAKRVLERGARCVPELEGRGKGTSGFGRTKYAVTGPGKLGTMEPFVHLCETAWALQIYEMVLAPTLTMKPADDHFASLVAWKFAFSQRMRLRRTFLEHFGEDWTRRAVDVHLLS